MVVKLYWEIIVIIFLPNNSLVGGGGNDNFNPYVIDSRIKDLESKLATFEQANKILIERIY